MLIRYFLRQKRGSYKDFMESLDFILQIIQKAEASWDKVTEDSCKIVRLVGNSNRVFLIQTSLPVSPKRFIFRIFGSGETLDVSTSSSILHRLSQNNVSPKIFLETPEYRIEEFLEGTRNLQRLECLEPSIANKIAKKIKEIHDQDLSDILDARTPVCITNVQKWRKLGESVLSKIKDSGRQSEINQALEALGETFYENYLDLLPKESPLVLSHMDTSFLNFLYKEEKEEIFLIDYDYAGYSYRGFDIAILLQDIKYDYNYPEYPFYQYYRSFPEDEVLSNYVKAYGEGADMFVECKRCMIAAHYFWAIWAFTLYDENSQGMDMLGYGLLRFREFLDGYNNFKDVNMETLKRQAETKLSE